MKKVIKFKKRFAIIFIVFIFLAFINLVFLNYDKDEEIIKKHLIAIKIFQSGIKGNN